MEEKWKQLTYPGYFVSSFGNILSSKRWKIIRNLSSTNGYLRVNLGNKNRGLLVHRLVAIAFLGVPKTKMEVNHKDGNRSNNMVENLEWVTRAQNHFHSWNTNVSRREMSQSSKLNWIIVKKIREEKRNGKKQKDIAKKYSISCAHICKILKNKSWPSDLCPVI